MGGWLESGQIARAVILRNSRGYQCSGLYDSFLTCYLAESYCL